jgi:hypothetical protein
MELEPEPELFKSRNWNRKKLLRFHNAVFKFTTMATVHRGIEMWGGGQVVKKIYYTRPWKLVTIPLYNPLKSPVGAYVHKTQCCGSGMFIPDPDFFTHPGSRIPDLRSKNSNKREG